eukprot:8590968-Pyramimonas_sp.AAC.1
MGPPVPITARMHSTPQMCCVLTIAGQHGGHVLHDRGGRGGGEHRDHHRPCGGAHVRAGGLLWGAESAHGGGARRHRQVHARVSTPMGAP